jgi:hypothetical protein
MVYALEGTPKQYYMDGYLLSNLDIAKKVIQKDWDMLFLIDGYEGSGKSTLAIKCAIYCDDGFDITRVTMTANEFRKAVIAAKPYQAVVYDEAYTGLSSRATMSMINRTLVNMLAEIRQKNLFVFIVMPSFFDVDKYVALWRSRALIHVYTDKNFERGYFSFYNEERKKDLYILGKKFYNYSKPQPNFRGRFYEGYGLDEGEYRKKKHDSLLKREQQREEAERQREIENLLFERVMKMGDSVSHVVKMELLSMPSSTYFLKLRKYNENGEIS